MAKKKEDIPIVRTPNFMKYYVTNVKGGLTNQDFRIELLNEKLKEENNWAYISDALIICSPIGAKKLYNLLKEMIITYEKEQGEIKLDSEEKVYNVD